MMLSTISAQGFFFFLFVGNICVRAEKGKSERERKSEI